jgi:hypothetical protein
MAFQTSHAEAARAALDVASQLQRDETFKKVLADRLATDMAAVKNIEKSDAMKAQERERRQRRFGGQAGEGEGKEGEQAEGANSADSSLDFLA